MGAQRGTNHTHTPYTQTKIADLITEAEDPDLGVFHLENGVLYHELAAKVTVI